MKVSDFNLLTQENNRFFPVLDELNTGCKSCVMQIGSSVRSGQTSFCCLSEPINAQQGGARIETRLAFFPSVVAFHFPEKKAMREDEL